MQTTCSSVDFGSHCPLLPPNWPTNLSTSLLFSLAWFYLFKFSVWLCLLSLKHLIHQPTVFSGFIPFHLHDFRYFCHRWFISHGNHGDCCLGASCVPGKLKHFPCFTFNSQPRETRASIALICKRNKARIPAFPFLSWQVILDFFLPLF